MFDTHTDEVVQTIQHSQGRILEEGEVNEIALWKRGQELRSVVGTEAWAIITDTLTAYADGAVRDLLGLTPGDPAVMTAHAAASALVQQNKYFKEDMEAAVRASYEMPETLKSTLREGQRFMEHSKDL